MLTIFEVNELQSRLGLPEDVILKLHTRTEAKDTKFLDEVNTFIINNAKNLPEIIKYIREKE